MDAGEHDLARELDEVAANATVAPLTRLVDGWLAKAAPGLPFRRANAVLPAAGAGDDEHAVAATLDVLEAWYGRLGQRVLVQVPDGHPSSVALDAMLAARGYEVEAPVDILVAVTADVADAGELAAGALLVAMEERHLPTTTGPSGMRIQVAESVDESWAQRYGSVHGDDEVWRGRTEAYGRMLAVLGGDVLAAAAVPPGDEVAGVAFAVLERGWAGIYGMGTTPAWRRRGVGATLAGALAAAARDRHAERLYLQVEVDNGAAQALYTSLGFTRHHGYHYRVSSTA